MPFEILQHGNLAQFRLNRCLLIRIFTIFASTSNADHPSRSSRHRESWRVNDRPREPANLSIENRYERSYRILRDSFDEWRHRLTDQNHAQDSVLFTAEDRLDGACAAVFRINRREVIHYLLLKFIKTSLEQH